MKTFLKIVAAAAIIGGIVYACIKWLDRHPRHTCRPEEEDLPTIDDEWDDFEIPDEPMEDEADKDAETVPDIEVEISEESK
jgi:hypothetical protein